MATDSYFRYDDGNKITNILMVVNWETWLAIYIFNLSDKFVWWWQ